MTSPERLWNIGQHTAELRARAARSGQSVIDLGQGTPSDPTPEVIRRALSAASDAPGYPTAHGEPELREAYSGWAQRRLGATVPVDDVLPTVGSKELIASLPRLLGLGSDAVVVVPELAYPTYSVGARSVRARVLSADSLLALGPERVNLIWLNTPGNPTGRVLGEAHLAKVVQWARSRDCIVASDECYLELGPPGTSPASILGNAVNGGDLTGILAVHSLSKRSSMAGYRAGFVSGDPQLIARLLRQRRDEGMLMPAPIQAAATAALADDRHVVRARAAYARRRELLKAALLEAGFRVDESEAGLFLWATRAEQDSDTVEALLALGIVAAPGSFYGPAGARHVRFSLTAPETLLEQACARIVALREPG